VKAMINHLRYRYNKEYYKIKKDSIIKIVNKCGKTINSAKKIKRQTEKFKILNEENNDTDELFSIIGIPKENTGQIGGESPDELHKDIYSNNKIAYLNLCKMV
jgi:hypothetical protein